MKNLFVLAIVGSLLLAGCAGKKVVEDQAANEPVPAVVEQEPVKTEPTVTERAEIPQSLLETAEVKQAAERIFFEFDSYLLTPASKEALEGNALWLQDQQEVRVVIEGHADERGSDTYNLALGENRSRAVRDYLVKLGIAPDRIKVISYGEEKATRGATTETAWAQDRRAEFVTTN